MALALIGGRTGIERGDVLLLREDRALEDFPRQVEFLRDALIRVGDSSRLEFTVDPELRVAANDALDPVVARPELELELDDRLRALRRALSAQIADLRPAAKLAEERPADRLGDRRLAGAVLPAHADQPVRELDRAVLDRSATAGGEAR